MLKEVQYLHLSTLICLLYDYLFPYLVITLTPAEPGEPGGSDGPGGTGGTGGQGGDAANLTVPIVGGVVGGIVLILAITVVVVIIIFVMRAKRGLNHYHLGSNGTSKDLDAYDGEEPFYQELTKPAPPPLPIRFPSPMGSSQIGPYAMVNNVTGNGHFELMEQNFNSRASLCSEPESNTMPMRLHKQPNFLQNNPLYASADALDRADPPNLPFRREVGSVPPLDYSASPHGSAFNIYAQPSKVAPPIPRRPSTPTLLGGPIYSEANISPAVFKQPRRLTASPPEPEQQMCPYASVYNDPKPLQRSEGPMELDMRNIRAKGNLGVGQFGQVVLAETVGVSLMDLGLSDTNDDKSVSVLVAVKKLKSNADEFIKEAFEKEIKFMTRLKHENVIQLLGICLYGDAFIVMEYMEKGDLNQYLHKCEIAPTGSAPGKNQLLPSTLLYMSLQIANGMKYLASFHFIHRDLATRNCLVGKNNEVKIADFGMSRSLYSSYYYRIRGRAMLPIRWMANECFYGKFSEKTDVWAFGVTMWEIFTFAKKQPYETMTDQEVIDDAIKGPDRQLLKIPEHCPPEVFNVMVGCWVDDPDKRVNFNDVHSSLAAIYDSSSDP